MAFAGVGSYPAYEGWAGGSGGERAYQAQLMQAANARNQVNPNLIVGRGGGQSGAGYPTTAMGWAAQAPQAQFQYPADPYARSYPQLPTMGSYGFTSSPYKAAQAQGTQPQSGQNAQVQSGVQPQSVAPPQFNPVGGPPGQSPMAQQGLQAVLQQAMPIQQQMLMGQYYPQAAQLNLAGQQAQGESQLGWGGLANLLGRLSGQYNTARQGSLLDFFGGMI